MWLLSLTICLLIGVGSVMCQQLSKYFGFASNTFYALSFCSHPHSFLLFLISSPSLLLHFSVYLRISFTPPCPPSFTTLLCPCIYPPLLVFSSLLACCLAVWGPATSGSTQAEGHADSGDSWHAASPTIHCRGTAACPWYIKHTHSQSHICWSRIDCHKSFTHIAFALQQKV